MSYTDTLFELQEIQCKIQRRLKSKPKLVKIHSPTPHPQVTVTYSKELILQSREEASLHCSFYRQCIMGIKRAGSMLNCHSCNKKVLINNHYRKELGIDSINGDGPPYPLHIPKGR